LALGKRVPGLNEGIWVTGCAPKEGTIKSDRVLRKGRFKGKYSMGLQSKGETKKLWQHKLCHQTKEGLQIF